MLSSRCRLTEQLLDTLPLARHFELRSRCLEAQQQKLCQICKQLAGRVRRVRAMLVFAAYNRGHKNSPPDSEKINVRRSSPPQAQHEYPELISNCFVCRELVYCKILENSHMEFNKLEQKNKPTQKQWLIGGR